MDLFQGLSAFAKVVELGSFARAAERLGASTSSVSRQVADLEAHLDVRLLNRTTRRLSLTEAGQAFHERCVQLLADLDEAESSVRVTAVEPRGTLRITCGVTFGVRYLAAALAEFAERHPAIAFDLDLSDRVVDLVDEGYDLAIRIGPVGQRGLVARRIGTTRFVCCASPAYLESHPPLQTPADLARHSCFAYTYVASPDAWRFGDADGREQVLRVPVRHRANNGRILVELAVAGLGVVYEPDFIVAPEVRSGRLVRVLAGFPAAPSPISVVYPSRRHLSAKVRAFVGFIAERFAQEQPWSLD